MSEQRFDRNSAEHAAEIMSALCSSAEEQQIILRQLITSIDTAEKHAPNSWAVTLFDNGFRLNVGPVEAFTFFDGCIRSLFIGLPPVEAQQHGEVVPMQYRSVPQPQHCYIGSIAEFHKVASALAPLHSNFLQAATVTSKGLPRKSSSFKNSNSLGLVTYARAITVNTQTANTFASAPAQLFEGAMHRVSSNRYERNEQARNECIQFYGPTCVICGLNFQSVYGATAAGFIHVHHITPISAIGESYKVNPIKDLVPLCPNCHCVVHLANPPHSIEQVKKMRSASQAQQGAPADPQPSASLRVAVG